jgi:hypothetical protein
MAQHHTVQEDGRIWDISDITIAEECRDSDYSLSYNKSATLGPTARWWLFEIVHSTGQHSFRGRWDEEGVPLGTRCTVDIDKVSMVGGKEVISKDFKGHHTNPLSGNDLRQYDIDVRETGKIIFRGTISFRTTRRVRFAAGTTTFAATTTNILQASKWQRYWNYFRRFWIGLVKRMHATGRS